MQNYTDRNGDSGVAAFEIEADGIAVQFKTGSVYLYNYGSAGQSIIETMKRLALAGDGLNAYINTNAKQKYARKLR